MRIERSTTSISWIPSDSIPGLLRLPFDRGVMHYDPPPSLTLDDVEGMRRRGEFRLANRLSAYVEVEDGQITGYGYTGGKVMGLTPLTAGPLRVMLPTIGHRDIQWQPAVSGDEVTFVQTAGGRPGFSYVKPTWRWPFLVTKPFTIWTTLRLTIKADGTCTRGPRWGEPVPASLALRRRRPARAEDCAHAQPGVGAHRVRQSHALGWRGRDPCCRRRGNGARAGAGRSHHAARRAARDPAAARRELPLPPG